MTLRLLVADDNAAMRKMVTLAYTGENAVVEAVSSGDAAIGTLHKFRPDVVLADVSMPGYSGYEVCELIRRDSQFAAIPVILLNGAFDPLDVEEAARVEASGLLTKPFDPSEMIGLVEKLLLDPAHRLIHDFSDNTANETGTGTEIPAPPADPAADADFIHEELSENAETSEPDMESGALDSFFHIPPHAWESYFGPDRILEIFNDETFSGKASADRRIPDGLADRVAERVAEKMLPAIKTLIRRTPADRE
ncbi:MAG: response regulator [Acidobacteria bacterium]|nr:response regulator [Acidobacteriota bacterium]